MSALFVDHGYGQVEANRLSGITFGNIEAQAPAYEAVPTLPTDITPIAELENGMFLVVVPDTYAAGTPGAEMGRVAVLPGEDANAVPYLVYSEKKLYDERHGYADFVDKAADKVDGLLYPKLIGIVPDSCVFTTNTLNCAKYDPTAATPSVAVGDVFYIGDDGYLTKTAGTNKVYCFEVSKITTMPDGQYAVKLQAKKYHV